MRRSKKNPLSASVRRASRWLTASGLQNQSRDPKLRGGVASWYELDRKVYPFLYSEITGYALTAFAFLYRLTGEKKYVTRARLAGRWLISNALGKQGGVRTRLYLEANAASPNYSFEVGRVYAFDASMAGYGLLQSHAITKDRSHLEAASRVMAFLLGPLSKDKARFHPYWDVRSGSGGEDAAKWSDQSGSYHAKHALFLIDFYRRTKDPKALRRAKALLNWTVSVQEKNGRFVTARGDGSTHLHPHSYTLEGLIYGGVHLKNKKYLSAARKGFQWMVSAAAADGSVASIWKNGKFDRAERSDIVAQFLRIGAMLAALDTKAARPYLATLEAVKKHLLSLQYDGKGKQRGGFAYGPPADAKSHLNSWCTMFALQALWMHDAFVLKKKPLCVDRLI